MVHSFKYVFIFLIMSYVLLITKHWHRPILKLHTKFFKKAQNECKSVLRKAKTSYAQSIKDKIGAERLGFREFWRIINQVQIRLKKNSIPTLINGPETVSSSADKAKIFASIFASNSTLDDQGQEVSFFNSWKGRNFLPWKFKEFEAKMDAKMFALSDEEEIVSGSLIRVGI